MGSVFVPLAVCMDTSLVKVQFNLSKLVRVSSEVQWEMMDSTVGIGANFHSVPPSCVIWAKVFYLY